MKPGIIDCHSHILPRVDDGSAALDESIALMRMEAEQGIEQVLATPHFYAKWDRPESFLERRAAAEVTLRAETDKLPGLPKIILGAEVAYFPGMSETEWLPELTIAGGNAILVEMPAAPWTDSMYLELEQIWEMRKIVPVIAHIDRYIRPLRSFRIPERLAELTVLVQANTHFFLNRTTSAMAMRMLKANQIHLLGSDCHNTLDRPPNLGRAIQRIEAKLGQPVLERICKHQRKILDIT